MKKHHGGPIGNKTTFKLPSNLTRKEAIRKAIKKVGGDFRGFKYDSKTGRTTVV